MNVVAHPLFVTNYCLLSLEQVDELLSVRATTITDTSGVGGGAVSLIPPRPTMSKQEKSRLLQEYDCTEDDTVDRYNTMCVCVYTTLCYIILHAVAWNTVEINNHQVDRFR